MNAGHTHGQTDRDSDGREGEKAGRQEDAETGVMVPASRALLTVSGREAGTKEGE